jgi:hypothetical protein
MFASPLSVLLALVPLLDASARQKAMVALNLRQKLRLSPTQACLPHECVSLPLMALLNESQSCGQAREITPTNFIPRFSNASLDNPID